VERIQNINVEVVEVGLPAIGFRFPVVALSRLFRRLNPDVVHTRGWGTVDAIVAARVAGVPRVLHGEHGREASDPEGLNRKRNLVRRALSVMVDRFVSVSDDLRLWLTQSVGISEQKVVTIHNGVDTVKFSPFKEEQGAKYKASGSSPSSAVRSLRRSLGLPEDAFVIGTVGRLDPVKGHTTLLDAFAPLARMETPICLVVVGDGPIRGEIESHAIALGVNKSILFLGEREDIPVLLRAFDVFALSSVAEGISNTILEAMASGLPIVATRVGGNPELVEDEITGQLIPSKNSDSLAAAFERYLRDPERCRRHGIAGRARAEKYFSLDHMATQYEKLYLNLAPA